MLKKNRPFKNTRLLALTAACFFIAVIVISSCKPKDDDPDPKPVISSIAPTTALPGESIVITGNYFADGAASTNKVYFGTTGATITSQTKTQINLTVPELTAGNYDLTVLSNTLTSDAKTFAVGGKVATISSFAPETGKFDDEITITGTNFGTDKSKVTVSVNGKEQEVLTVSDTQVKIKLAKKTFSGEVKVSVTDINGTQDITATKEFAYTDSYRVEEMFDLRILNIETDSKGNIYAVLYDDITFNVAKINKGETKIDTIVKYNAAIECYDVILNNNDELIIYGQKSSKVYKYKGKDNLEEIAEVPRLADPSPASLCYDSDEVLYVGQLMDRDIYKIVGSNATKFGSVDYVLFDIKHHSNGLFYSVGHANKVSQISSTSVSKYADVNNSLTSILIDPNGKFLVIDKDGKLLKENSDKTFTEWQTSLLSTYKLYAMCYTPEGDMLIGSDRASEKLIKLIIE